jgi:predicted Zn-dependent protease
VTELDFIARLTIMEARIMTALSDAVAQLEGKVDTAVTLLNDLKAKVDAGSASSADVQARYRQLDR